MSDTETRLEKFKRRAKANPARGAEVNADEQPLSIKENDDVTEGVTRTVRWFERVRTDLSQVEPALTYFARVYEQGEPHVRFKGQLEHLMAETAGLIAYYHGFYTDASQIRKWLNLTAENMIQKKAQWYMTDDNAKAEYGKVTGTDARKWAETEETVLNLKELERRFANAEHLLEGLLTGIQNRSYMLTNISEVRKSGHNEVWIDSTQETSNN